MEKPELIYEINGVKYLLVERMVTERNGDKLQSAIQRHQVIEQGVKQVSRGGMFSNPFAIVSLLVPFHTLIAFNAEIY